MRLSQCYTTPSRYSALKCMVQVYSLIGGFFASVVNFHAKDGSGYELLGDVVIQLDKLNPQVPFSTKLCHFSSWVLKLTSLMS